MVKGSLLALLIYVMWDHNDVMILKFVQNLDTKDKKKNIGCNSFILRDKRRTLLQFAFI